MTRERRVQDDDAWDETLEVRHSASGASDYTGVSEDLDVDVDDDDEAGILVFNRSSRGRWTRAPRRTYTVEAGHQTEGQA